MCETIKSEYLIKSYFIKYPRKKQVPYKVLNQIREKIELELGMYVDVSYSSYRSIASRYNTNVITFTLDKVMLKNRKVFLDDRVKIKESLSRLEKFIP